MDTEELDRADREAAAERFRQRKFGEPSKTRATPGLFNRVSSPLSPRPPLGGLDGDGVHLTLEEAERAKQTSQAMNEKRDENRALNLSHNLKQPLGTQIGPNEGFQFEGQKGDIAGALKDDYLERDPEAAFLQPDNSANPEEDSGDPWYTAQNIANTLFSDEMGLLGIKWTEEGATWAWENFRNQIVEHPYATPLTLASYLVPIGAAWMKGARVAQRAAKIAGNAEGIADASVVKARGLFGTVGGDQVNAMGGTLEAMKTLGPRVRFDDHAKLVKALALSPDANDGLKFFSDGRLKAIAAAASDEDIAKLVPEKELRKMLIGDMHMERYLALKNMAKKGEAMNPMRRAELKLWDTFGNRYFNNLTDMSKEQIEGMDKWLEKAGIGKWLATAPTLADKASEIAMYKLFAGKATYKETADAIGQEATIWADGLMREWTDLFKAQADEGFISDETVNLFNNEFGGFHLPAILEGTPGFEDFSTSAKALVGQRGAPGDVIKSRMLDPAKVLSPPTTEHRGVYTTWAKLEPDLYKMVTAPRALTAGGFIRDNTLFQIHRGFRDMIVGGVKKDPKVSQWLMDADLYDTRPDHVKKYWMSFEELDNVNPGLSSRMENMVNKQLAKEGVANPSGRLPVIDRDLVEQFFGKDGSAAAAAGMAGRLFELATSVHKTSRTALNVPTHMSNILGNFMFLAMAGMNPFSSMALKDGQMYTKAFTKLARDSTGDAGKSMEELLEFDNLVKVFGNDRYLKDDFGDKIDLAEIFAHPAFKTLIEAQSFEKTEGLQHTKHILAAMESLESSSWGSKAVTNVARAVASIGEAPVVKQTLHAMSSAYLGEDMVPKMMYVSHLLRKGWGVDAVIKEVGRRLPQYATVGNLQQKSRRVVLPWITFPSEAARIVKNNMMDNPVSMMAWMKAPSIAQSIAYAGGIAPDYSEIEEHLVTGAQPWADRYQSVYLKESKAAPVLGAVGGASALGMAGAAIGGPKLAAAGAVAGAVGGAMVGAQSPTHKRLSQDDLGSMARSWTMDFLPTSGLFFTTTHPSEWAKLDPFNPEPTTGMEVARTAYDMNPIEPFAIAMPLIDLAAGKGAFGRPIETKSGFEHMNKLALGLFGFMMPPALQKYGMKLESKGAGAYVPMAETFEANGGQMTLPKGVTATFAGLSTAGLTFLGARSKAIGATKSAARLAAATSGIPAAMAGAEVNTRRLMTDLGIMNDPYTNQKGDWTMDFFFNTFVGANKSWKVSTASSIDADNRRGKRFAESRAISQKNFMDALRNGADSKMIASAGEAYKTFQYEHVDSELADKKYMEWLERNMKSLKSTPQFASISEEMLKSRMILVKDELRTSKSRFLRQKLAEMETELQMRRLRKAARLKIVDVVPERMRPRKK